MKHLRFKDYLVVAGGVLLMALSISFAHVNPVGGAGSAPVTVVNTPLPVQGTVDVGNFPAANTVTGSVSITNTPLPVQGTVNANVTGSVGLTGTPNVNISNTPTVQITSAVQTLTGIPAGAFSVFQFHSASSVISGPDPAGTNYAITSVTFANPESSATESALRVAYGSTSDCVHFSPLLAVIDGPHAEIPANGRFTYPFSNRLCLRRNRARTRV